MRVVLLQVSHVTRRSCRCAMSGNQCSTCEFFPGGKTAEMSNWRLRHVLRHHRDVDATFTRRCMGAGERRRRCLDDVSADCNFLVRPEGCNWCAPVSRYPESDSRRCRCTRGPMHGCGATPSWCIISRYCSSRHSRLERCTVHGRLCCSPCLVCA